MERAIIWYSQNSTCHKLRVQRRLNSKGWLLTLQPPPPSGDFCQVGTRYTQARLDMKIWHYKRLEFTDRGKCNHSPGVYSNWSTLKTLKLPHSFFLDFQASDNGNYALNWISHHVAVLFHMQFDRYVQIAVGGFPPEFNVLQDTQHRDRSSNKETPLYSGNKMQGICRLLLFKSTIKEKIKTTFNKMV